MQPSETQNGLPDRLKILFVWHCIIYAIYLWHLAKTRIALIYYTEATNLHISISTSVREVVGDITLLMIKSEEAGHGKVSLLFYVSRLA